MNVTFPREMVPGRKYYPRASYSPEKTTRTVKSVHQAKARGYYVVIWQEGGQWAGRKETEFVCVTP